MHTFILNHVNGSDLVKRRSICALLWSEPSFYSGNRMHDFFIDKTLKLIH